MSRAALVRRVFLASAVVWAVGSIFSFTLTLRSLDEHGFDGLNNMLQLPFSLPWFFLVPASSTDHVLNARVDLLLGLFNAVLVALAGVAVAHLVASQDGGDKGA